MHLVAQAQWHGGLHNATKAHEAWCKAHGYTTHQMVTPVLNLDRATGVESISTTEVLTLRTGDDVPRDKHDAGWDAYIAQYRAVSSIVAERRICVTAGM